MSGKPFQAALTCRGPFPLPTLLHMRSEAGGECGSQSKPGCNKWKVPTSAAFPNVCYRSWIKQLTNLVHLRKSLVLLRRWGKAQCLKTVHPRHPLKKRLGALKKAMDQPYSLRDLQIEFVFWLPTGQEWIPVEGFLFWNYSSRTVLNVRLEKKVPHFHW